MQLDLFEDNKPGILLNIADEFIRDREFEQALSVYRQLQAEYPADRHFTALLELVDEWSRELDGLEINPLDPEKCNSIWQRLDSLSHPLLRRTVLDMLTARLRTLPEPARLYVAPRFHIGHLLLESGCYPEAADCFAAALSGPGLERGRFLAWRGDALTLANQHEDALKNYFEAFLDDPGSIDLPFIKNRTICNLIASLGFEAGDEIDEDQQIAWLPVWGWLQGVFSLPLLPLFSEEPLDSAACEAMITAEPDCVPRLWFDLLARAEWLRSAPGDGRELAAVRRLMKKTSGFMFSYYLDTVRGKG